MSQRARGIRRPLSPARTFICDMMRYAQKVPAIEIFRPMNVAALATARSQLDTRPAWSAIFMKAFALAARNYPFLRQVYMPLPWAHLYEYPHSICVLMVEREHRGEYVVLATKIRAPENQSLIDITAEVQRYKTEPVESLGRYRMALLSGSLPWPLRKLQWWSTLYVSGFKRVKRFGTFGVTSLGGFGIDGHPRGPGTSILAYGPIDERGDLTVRLVFDHRVMDAGNASRALIDMEAALHNEIQQELARSNPKGQAI